MTAAKYMCYTQAFLREASEEKGKHDATSGQGSLRFEPSPDSRLLSWAELGHRGRCSSDLCRDVTSCPCDSGHPRSGFKRIEVHKQNSLSDTADCGLFAIGHAKDIVTLRDLKTDQTSQVTVKAASHLKNMKVYD